MSISVLEVVHTVRQSTGIINGPAGMKPGGRQLSGSDWLRSILSDSTSHDDPETANEWLLRFALAWNRLL
jgi:hypothetical protein